MKNNWHIILFNHKNVFPDHMAEIVQKNVDQTASLTVTGLMESVNLAAIQDGKDLTVTQVMNFIIIWYLMYIS